MSRPKEIILVTGGAGFIGSHLCKRLIKEGYSVLCLDNFNDYYNPKIKEDNIKELKENQKFSLIRGDVLDKKLLKKIFSKNSVSKIVHLAAIPGVRPSLLFPGKYIDVDIKGTVNLLEMAKKDKIHFIFGSSSSVYGKDSKTPFREDDKELIPMSPYSTSKLAAEFFCQTYNKLYNIPITILRFFTVFGPGQRPEMAIHKLTRLMRQGKPVSIHGKGDSSRDYTFIDDIVDGVMKAIKKKFDCETFNLGNSRTIKLKDMIKILIKESGVKPRFKRLPDQLGDLPITYADISKAKKLLNWKPKVSFEEGVKRFLAWYDEKEDFLNKLNL